MSTAEEIRAAVMATKVKRTRTKVPVPCWGVDIWACQMDTETADEFENSGSEAAAAWEAEAIAVAKATKSEPPPPEEIERVKKSKVRARMLLFCCESEDGERVFKPEDLEFLAEHPMAPIRPLLEEVIKANAYTPDDLEELAKN